MKWLCSLGLLLAIVLLAAGLKTNLEGKFSKDAVSPKSNCPQNNEISSNVGGALRAAIVCSEPLNESITAVRHDSGVPVDCPSHTQKSDSQEQEPLIRRWASENPSAAAAWAEKQADPAVRQEALNQVALAWAESDLSKAIEWATSLPADGAKNVVLRNLGYEAARTEPLAALALASSLPPDCDRDALLVHAVSQWSGDDAQAATEWACKIKELPLRERVLAAIATAMADQNPETAVVLATQALWPGPSQNQAAIAIVQRWTQQDPQRAASWVTEFPEGANKDIAIGNLLAVWSDKDPKASSAWQDSLHY